MEEIDLSCCKSGILELTGRTGVAPLQCVFGVDEVDGKDKSEEDEKEGDVKVLPIFFGHRIPWQLIYEKREVKVKFKTGLRILRRLRTRACHNL
jgi:hypothetical protein